MKIQIDLNIHTDRSGAELIAIWIAKDATFLSADNEDSDQTAHLRSLIRVFTGRTCDKVRFLILHSYVTQWHVDSLCVFWMLSCIGTAIIPFTIKTDNDRRSFILFPCLDIGCNSIDIGVCLEISTAKCLERDRCQHVYHLEFWKSSQNIPI